MPATLYLASQSPRRASLIKLLGIPNVTIRAANIHEAMEAGVSPSDNVRRLAEHKAQAIAAELAEGIVLGADTTVAIDGEVLEKPLDPADAERMLARLSGQTHTVHTGVALVNAQTNEMISFVESTEVTFRKLGTEEIRAYVATGAPMDKAGAYGIQEDFGAVFVRQIDGDYYTVVGLPVCRLYMTLKTFSPEVFAEVTRA